MIESINVSNFNTNETKTKTEASFTIPTEEIVKISHELKQSQKTRGFLNNLLQKASLLAENITKGDPANFKPLRNFLLILLVSSYNSGCSVAAIADIDSSSNKVASSSTQKTENLKKFKKYNKEQIKDLVRNSKTENAFIGTGDNYYEIAEGTKDSVSIKSLNNEFLEEMISSHEEPTTVSHTHPSYTALEDLKINKNITQKKLEKKLYNPPSAADLSVLVKQNLKVDLKFSGVKRINFKVFDYNGIWNIKMIDSFQAKEAISLFLAVVKDPSNEISWREMEKIYKDQSELQDFKNQLQSKKDENGRLDLAGNFLWNLYFFRKLERYDILSVDLYKSLKDNDTDIEIKNKTKILTIEAEKQGFDISFETY